jgi:hypothetical protein
VNTVFIVERRYDLWHEDRWEFIGVYVSLDAVMNHAGDVKPLEFRLEDTTRLAVEHTWIAQQHMVLGNHTVYYRVHEMQPLAY